MGVRVQNGVQGGYTLIVLCGYVRISNGN